MTTLLIVRHAQAAGNRESRFIGQSDVPLTDLGRNQAELVGARLGEYPITKVVSSDLQRCTETIRPAVEGLGLSIQTDPRLREIANGEWGDLLATDIAAGWPDLWRRHQAGGNITRPGGESWIDVEARVIAAMRDMAAGVDEDDVILVGTHAGPLLLAVMWAVGVDWSGNVFRQSIHEPENASISVITMPGPRLLSYNDCGHL